MASRVVALVKNVAYHAGAPHGRELFVTHAGIPLKSSRPWGAPAVMTVFFDNL